MGTNSDLALPAGNGDRASSETKRKLSGNNYMQNPQMWSILKQNLITGRCIEVSWQWTRSVMDRAVDGLYFCSLVPFHTLATVWCSSFMGSFWTQTESPSIDGECHSILSSLFYFFLCYWLCEMVWSGERCFFRVQFLTPVRFWIKVYSIPCLSAFPTLLLLWGCEDVLLVWNLAFLFILFFL